MCASRAAFSRSIFAVATMVSATFAAPALAEQFSFGLHLYSAPEGFAQELYIGIPLAKDGSAVGATYYQPSDPNRTLYGSRITPSGTTIFAEPSRAVDISDGGAYTADLRNRRNATGVIDQILPADTRFSLALDFKPHISGNGATVAGSVEVFSSNMVVGTNAYRWTEAGGLQNLPDYRTGAIFTSVYGLSQDGSTIVGGGRTDFFGDDDAWKWTPQDGYTILPILPNATSAYARANAVNGDGSIIVGEVKGLGTEFRAAIWRGDQITTLAPLPGYRFSAAYDLSDDGSIITGVNGASNVGLPQVQTIWTEDTGWIPALDYFRLQGVEIPSYLLASSVHVSADGRTFSLQMYDTRTSEAYIGIVVVPSPGILSVLGVVSLFSRGVRAQRIG